MKSETKYILIQEYSLRDFNTTLKKWVAEGWAPIYNVVVSNNIPSPQSEWATVNTKPFAYTQQLMKLVEVKDIQHCDKGNCFCKLDYAALNDLDEVDSWPCILKFTHKPFMMNLESIRRQLKEETFLYSGFDKEERESVYGISIMNRIQRHEKWIQKLSNNAQKRG